MAWNYRVVKREYDGEMHAEVCEVYYNEKGEPSSFSAETPNVLFADTVEELKEVYERVGLAFENPVLLWDEGLHKLIELNNEDE